MSTQSTSLQGLYLTLAPVAVTAGIYFSIFLILRRSQKRWYAPRTYLGSLKASERTPALPGGLFNWFASFWKIPDIHVLQHQSLDAYLFLRYLRMTVVITFVGCCITWPVLFPVNATGGAGQKQLDILSYSNVDRTTFKKRCRYFAHLFVGWIYYIFVMYLIFRECIYYINLRQAFLLSPFYSQRLSSRTVLFTSLPENLRDEQRLRKVFGDAVRNVWLLRDTKQLEDDVEERDKAAYRLEAAEVKLIKKANEARIKAAGKGAGSSAVADAEKGGPPGSSSGLTSGAAAASASLADAESGSLAARYIKAKDRPTHRTGLLGLIGPKVDSIDWCRTELARLIPKIRSEQDQYRLGKPTAGPAVFIEFRTQAQAEAAYQTLAHHEGLHMGRHIGITPGDVVWSSLSIPWWQLAIRRYAVLAFITALIIFWAIPVAVVGLISNVNYLETISFLTWLKKVPTVIMGFITGLLPSVLLSVLMSLVPVVMRLCARLSGEPSHSRVELFTQNAFFCFEVIQVFLVTTLSSAATAVAKQIVDNPSSATTLLATNLPKSSNFYMSYFIVQGLTVASSTISQVVGLVIFRLLYKYLTGTPRGLYQKWTSLSAISWGSTLPVYTTICVIAITYSVIAPLVLGWACLGMSLFYFAYRYNVLFVTDTQIDTRGLIYPRALKQLMTGIYLSELCMIGLFASSVAIIQLVFMIVFLVFTVLFHITLNSALDPLLYNMPISLMAEEALRMQHGSGGDLEAAANGANGTNMTTVDSGHGSSGTKEKSDYAYGHTGATTAVPARSNFLTRFLKPWVFANYESMRALVPQHAREIDFAQMYTPELVRDAYVPPAVSSEAPLLWIAEDPAGISKQEVAHTSRILPITDDGCILDEKNKLVWDTEETRPPVWEEKVLY